MVDAGAPSRLVELAELATLNDEGRLSSKGIAQLGWLLSTLWRDHYGLEKKGGPADTLRQLKAHSEVGRRYLFLSAWLHDPTAATDREVAAFILKEVDRLAAADRSSRNARGSS